MRVVGLGLFAVAASSPTREQKGSNAIIAGSAPEVQAGPGPNGLARTPPMGWMSWQVFRCETDCTAHSDSCIDHNLYEQHADRIAADGYLAAGYDQVSIDDCWENHRGRDGDGHLIPDASRFPDGMKALGDYMHSKGVLFGTYSDEGTLTCGGFPGTKDHEEEDAKTFASWGVDYLKLDGCYNTLADYRQGYTAMGQALRAQSRPIVYSCSWPAYLGTDEDSKPFDEMIAAGCNLWRNWDDIQCNWGSLSSIIDHWGDFGAALQAAAAPTHWNDPDMLLIGAYTPAGDKCITLAEERTQMAIWSLIAAPLIMGNDVRKVDAESSRVLLNKEAIAIDQDILGKQGLRLSNSSARQQIWVRELATGEVAVGLYNKGGVAPPPIHGPPCTTWNSSVGGYYEAAGGAAGNLGTFSGLSAAEAQAECCANLECSGFSFSKASGSGFYKRNAQGGFVHNSDYDGYTKPSQLPPAEGSAALITLDFALLGAKWSAKTVAVRDVWAGADLGNFKGSFSVTVDFHDTAFLRLKLV